MATTTRKPPTLADVDYRTLGHMGQLPGLREQVEAHEALCTEANAAERAATQAGREFSLIYDASGQSLMLGHTEDEPMVGAARERWHAAKKTHERLVRDCAASRQRLDAATSLAAQAARPHLQAQLGPPLATLIAGLEAAQAADRLLGLSDHRILGFREERRQMTAWLAYLKMVHTTLEA